MNRRSAFFYVTACWLLPAMVACLAAPGAPAPKTALPVEVLTVGGQCFPAPETWTATWISSPKQLRETVSRCKASRIDAVPEEAPSVDYDQFGVLAVEMGARPTAGYGFDAGKVTAFVEDRTATVNLVHHRPPPGAVTAQMMTAPFLLIRMPLGSYGGIRVMDQDGRLLAESHFK